MPAPQHIKIYRMIHWSNVEHVLRNGLCVAGHALADPEFVAIGHSQLIKDRNSHHIPIEPGGIMSEYIPFYFAGHSPMLYAIKTGYNVTYRPQEDIVFLECDFNNVVGSNVEYVFTDRNAKMTLAQFFNNPANISQLKWEYIQTQWWRNEEGHMKRQDFKMAEFLVKNYLDVNYIDQLWVKNEERKVYFEEIINNLALPIVVNIDVNSHLYY